ncbi:MAG: alpha/beta hydrolase [Chitinophagales bacterium]
MKKFILLPLFLFVLLTATQWRFDIPAEKIEARFSYPHSEFFEYKDMRIHYCVEGKGEPLVLIHGTASSLHTWEGWVERLKNDFKIIRLDLPGFGLTGPNPSKDYSEELYAEVVEALLKHLNIHKAHIAGNSLGGAVAFHFAALYPEMTKSLVLIDASGYHFGRKIPFIFRITQYPGVAKLMTGFSPRFIYKWNIRQVYGNTDLITDTLIDRYYLLSLRKGNRQAMVDRMQQVENKDSKLIDKIKAPTLILWGEEDEWIPLDFAYKFKEDIPHSKLILFPGAGHVPMEEIPVPTADSTKKFIKNLNTELL